MKMIFGNKMRNHTLTIDTNKSPVVLASIGLGSVEMSYESEVEKSMLAKKYGAFAVIDHTLTQQYETLQKRIIDEVDIPVCAIAVYEMIINTKVMNMKCFSKENVINQFRLMVQRGIDLITIHASVRLDDLAKFYKEGRIIPCTSRGGTMVMKNMLVSGQENPYFEGFDELLEIAKEYNVGISLGSIYRPASVVDAIENNSLYFNELDRNAELVTKALSKGVAIMVEGFGHVPLKLIPEVTKKSIQIIHGVPFRVLTVSTDSALGFDHVSSSIAVASATQNGASVVTAVSRSEHLGRPSIDDVREAVISAKIASHIGFSSRISDFSLDRKMTISRAEVGCAGAIENSIVPELTKDALRQDVFDTKKCTMCGDYCALDAADIVQGQENENR